MNEYQVVYINTYPDEPSDNTVKESKDEIPPEMVHLTLEEALEKYLLDYAVEDNFVVGYFNELDTFKEIMEMMKNKGFAFSVRDSDIRQRKFKKSEEQDESKPEDSGHHTVFYQLRAMPIKFFGLPFTIEKTTHYHCAYGCKYYKSRSESKVKTEEGTSIGKGKKKRNVGSKKMGCLAKMTFKNITVYPDYKLDVESDWRKKKKLIESLRNDLLNSDKTVNRFQRFYLSVSIQSSHNHPPIIVLPKQKVRKRTPTYKGLVKQTSKSKKPKPDSFSLNPIQINGNGEIELASFTLTPEEQTGSEAKTLNLQDENFFHTLVKFPQTQTTFSENEFNKPVELSVEMSGFDPPDESDRTVIQTYEYDIGSIQYVQSLFREKLKRLYTLSDNCLNGPLLVRLIDDLEQIEVSLSSDVGYTTPL